MALGVLFVALTPGYVPDIESYLFGNILLVTSGDLILAGVFAVVITAVVALLYQPLLAVTFDEEYATVMTGEDAESSSADPDRTGGGDADSGGWDYSCYCITYFACGNMPHADVTAVGNDDWIGCSLSACIVWRNFPVILLGYSVRCNNYPSCSRGVCTGDGCSAVRERYLIFSLNFERSVFAESDTCSAR